MDALGVAADECAYVGDGGSHELPGAERLGMLAIRYAPSVPDDSDVVEADDSWRGPVVRELAELATLLGR